MFFNFYQFKPPTTQIAQRENNIKLSPLARAASIIGLALMLVGIVLGIIYHSLDIPIYTINVLGWIQALIITLIGFKKWRKTQVQEESCPWYKQYLLTGGIAIIFMALSLSISYGLFLSPLIKSPLFETHADLPLTADKIAAIIMSMLFFLLAALFGWLSNRYASKQNTTL